MRVILYLRVSTDDQSYDMQRAALDRYCTDRDWQVVGVVQETESGARTDRPERARILKDAERRRGRTFDAVAVWKLDRWGRSTGDVVTTIETLIQHDCGFVSVTEALDLTTPAGRAMLGMLAVFAQFERDMIRERVNAGIARYREKHPNQWGRPATARQVSGYVRDLRAKGLKVPDIARKAGISVASAYRILKQGVESAS